jgi:F0F1-type ATP synthase membrane subunit b/b'
MILVTRNWRMWMIGMGVSLAIFLVVYFTAIRPTVDTANQAVRSGVQQAQQAVNQAQKQISSANGQAGTIDKQAKQQLSRAATLTKCVATAGTDVSKITACQTRYGG